MWEVSRRHDLSQQGYQGRCKTQQRSLPMQEMKGKQMFSINVLFQTGHPSGNMITIVSLFLYFATCS